MANLLSLLPLLFLEVAELLVLLRSYLLLSLDSLLLRGIALFDSLELLLADALFFSSPSNLLLDACILLLQLLQFAILFFSCFAITVQLCGERGDLLLPHTQLLLQRLQLFLLVLRVGRLFDRVALRIVLFLELFDRLL